MCHQSVRIGGIFIVLKKVPQGYGIIYAHAHEEFFNKIGINRKIPMQSIKNSSYLCHRFQKHSINNLRQHEIMRSFQIKWQEISEELNDLREDCIGYLTEKLNEPEHKDGISTEPEDGSSVTVTYDGGKHPEYNSTAFSTVKGVYKKNDSIMLDTEDDDEYPISRISTIELFGVCDFIEDYCL